MSKWDIEFAERQRAVYERAKQQMRELAEQEQLRAAKAEAEAKLRATAVKNEKPALQPGERKIRGRRWRRDFAEAAIKAKFPTGLSKELPNHELQRQTREWLVENYPSLADQIKPDTIRAAAGRK